MKKEANIRSMLHLLVAMMAIVMIACGSEEKIDEPLAPDTKIVDDDWQTIPASGGTIEKDDITIEFPNGTFSKDTKVAVSEVSKGQICGDKEVSKFYQITMPVSTAKSFTIKIKCEEKGEDMNAVVHSPGLEVSEKRQCYHNLTVESSYTNGEYTVNIPVFTNGQTDETASFSIGIAHMLRIGIGYAGTRGWEQYIKQVGNAQWHFDDVDKKYHDNLMKISADVKRALENIQNLGFELSEWRDIPIHFEDLKTRGENPEPLSGAFTQDNFLDSWSSITIHTDILKNYENHLTDDQINSKRTPIHELLHYYQADLDPRVPLIKAKTRGEENLLYESAAVWIEKFNDDGTPSEEFVRKYLEEFVRGLNNAKELNNGNYARHGYGMSALLEYITTKRTHEKFDKNSVSELYKQWKDDANSTKTAFNKTAFVYLKNWVESDKHKSDLFKGWNYDDFLLKLMKGEVLSGYNISKYNCTKNITRELTDMGEVSISEQCYPYGCLPMHCTIDGEIFNEKGFFNNKQLVIEQKGIGVQTYVLYYVNKKVMQFKGEALRDSPIIIDGKTLESFRKNDNERYFFLFYPMSTTYTNEKPLSSEVVVRLEDAEENENVFPGEVYRIEAVLSAKFAHKTNVSQGETQKRLGVDINTGPEYPNSTIDISYTKDGIHVEGKTGNGNSQTSVSFDIVGTKDGIKNSKIQNLNINNKKTESVGYSATADNISTVIEYGDRIIYRGSVSDGMKLENVRNDVPDETYTYIDDPTNSVTVEIHYR